MSNPLIIATQRKGKPAAPPGIMDAILIVSFLLLQTLPIFAMFRGEIRGEQGKEDDLQDGLPKQSFFETNFNMTLDIVGRIVGSHKVTRRTPGTC